MVTSVPPYLEYRTVWPTLMSSGDQLAGVLGALAGADSQDLALLRLLLGGVGDDQAGGRRLLGLVGLYDDAVIERLQGHGQASIGSGGSETEALALGRCECQW